MGQHRDPCIFCKEDKPLTRQHVWPAWLGKIFPHPKNSATNLSQTLAAVTPPHGFSISPKTKTRQGYMLSIKFRKVCASCNNVWLSSIEEAVKPNVEKLILGRQALLSNDDLRSLSIWVSIVAIMAEFTHPENMGIPQHVPNMVYRDESPLPFSRIYIGQYLGSEYAPFRYRHLAGILLSPVTFYEDLPLTKIPNCQTSVFVLGELVVVIDSADKEHYSDFVQPRSGGGSPLIQIHPLPSAPVVWPPSAALGDAMLDFIHNSRFSSFGELPEDLI